MKKLLNILTTLSVLTLGTTSIGNLNYFLNTNIQKTNINKNYLTKNNINNDIFNLDSEPRALTISGEDWYAGTINGQLYKNGDQIANFRGTVNDLAVNGNDWYAAIYGEGKVYKNGFQIAKFSYGVEKLAVNGNDWYAATYGENKVYKNGFETVGEFDSNIWSIAVSKNGDIYIGCMNGKVYKNGNEIANFSSGVTEIALNGNDWYTKLQNKNKLYKNGNEIANFESPISALAISSEDWYVGCENGKIYKNSQEIENLNSKVLKLAVNGNDWYAGTNDNKIYVRRFTWNNDILFEKDYRFLAHDWLKIKISYETFKNMKKIYYSKRKSEIQNYFYILINSFPKLDNSGSGGSISQSDIYTTINVIIKNFKEINNFYEKLLQGQGLLIVTNTIGSWDKSDSMGAFSQ